MYMTLSMLSCCTVLEMYPSQKLETSFCTPVCIARPGMAKNTELPMMA